jgi:hypothetical protein
MEVKEKAIDLKIGKGHRVEIELVSCAGEGEHLEFTLVADEQADFSAGFLGIGTPLAKAILGKIEGNELEYALGDVQRVRILSVSISDRVQSEDVTARREAVMRKALKHSDYVNALTFATSVNSKWGDYDIDSLDPDQWTIED